MPYLQLPYRMINTDLLRKEITFSTSRAGGPGGQHVNKVETKVTLKFDVLHSSVLSEQEKGTVFSRLASYITRDGCIVLASQESRSQVANKELVLQKLNDLLIRAFKKQKARKATKPSRSSKRRRIKSKKLHGEKKKWRQKP